MKGSSRKLAPLIGLAAFVGAGSADAMVPVVDFANLFMNKLNFLMLGAIRDELHNRSSGTVNNNTYVTAENTTNISTQTTNISKLTQLNYDIDTSFTWIINNNGGEIIPIPDPVKEKLAAILGSRTIEKYTGNYKMASDFGANLPEGGYDAAIEGSRSRKAANDALVTAVSEDQASLDSELAGLKELRNKAKNAPQGQGHQLQVANALSASQVNQMMKLRSMMVASEAVRAAESQVAADKDARAIAIGKHMRIGLDDAVSHSIAPRAAY